MSFPKKSDFESQINELIENSHNRSDFFSDKR